MHNGHESVDSVWISPQAALKEAKAGKRTIIFPTRMNLKQLGQSATAAEAIGRADTVTAPEVMPTMMRKGADVYLTLPQEAGYGKIEIPLSKIMG